MEVMKVWLAAHWPEVVGLIVASTAAVYAALAYRTARRAADHAKVASLASLRVEARSRLVAAKRNYAALTRRCNDLYREWQADISKNGPLLTRHRSKPPPIITTTRRDGNTIMQQLKRKSHDLNSSDAATLERLIADADAAIVQIDALAVRLEEPDRQFF